MFVGYHGTNHVAAQTIVNRIAPVPRGNNTENEEKWGGLYVATHAEVAHGYARIKEGTGEYGLPTRAERDARGVMLRVYIPRASLERFYRTNTPLENAEEHITQVIGHSLPLRNEAFTGPESAGGKTKLSLAGIWRFMQLRFLRLFQGTLTKNWRLMRRLLQKSNRLAQNHLIKSEKMN